MNWKSLPNVTTADRSLCDQRSRNISEKRHISSPSRTLKKPVSGEDCWGFVLFVLFSLLNFEILELAKIFFKRKTIQNIFYCEYDQPPLCGNQWVATFSIDKEFFIVYLKDILLYRTEHIDISFFGFFSQNIGSKIKC